MNGGRWHDIEFMEPDSADVWCALVKARWPRSYWLLTRLVLAFEEIELAVNRDENGEEPIGDDKQFDRECVRLLRRALEVTE